MLVLLPGRQQTDVGHCGSVRKAWVEVGGGFGLSVVGVLATLVARYVGLHSALVLCSPAASPIFLQPNLVYMFFTIIGIRYSLNNRFIKKKISTSVADPDPH